MLHYLKTLMWSLLGAQLSILPTHSTHTAEVTPAQPLLQLSQVCA